MGLGDNTLGVYIGEVPREDRYCILAQYYGIKHLNWSDVHWERILAGYIGK